MKILNVFKKVSINILKKFIEKLKLFFTIDSHFRVLKICVGGGVGRSPGFSLEPLMYMLLQKFRQGKTLDKIVFKMGEGAMPPCSTSNGPQVVKQTLVSGGLKHNNIEYFE